LPQGNGAQAEPCKAGKKQKLAGLEEPDTVKVGLPSKTEKS
jgi:hypothetical protein